MLVCKGQQDIPETTSVPDDSLKKAVFSLKSHCPKGSNRAKFLNELRIMFQETMLGFECLLGKNIKESAPVQS